MPADFSHLRKPSLSWLVTLIERGVSLGNESFVDGIKNVRPPLLPEPETEAVTEFLTPLRTVASGRKKKGLSRAELVHQLRKIDRDDVPRLFIESVCERLEGPHEKPAIALRKALAEHRSRQRSNQELLIRTIYPIALKLVQTRGPWEHDLLGKVDRPPDLVGSRREKALAVTAEWLRQRGFQPPSVPSMRNILSKW